MVTTRFDLPEKVVTFKPKSLVTMLRNAQYPLILFAAGAGKNLTRSNISIGIKHADLLLFSSS
jgi:hypothetical protein